MHVRSVFDAMLCFPILAPVPILIRGSLPGERVAWEMNLEVLFRVLGDV